MTILTRALDFPLTRPIRDRVESRVRSAVEPVSGRVMIVTARLDAIDAGRAGTDKRCRLFAGLRKSGTVVAEATDADLGAAIDRAAGRLRRAVVEAVRRQAARDRRPRPSRRESVGV